MILTTDVCILALANSDNHQKPIVYTCRRPACKLTQTTANIANSGLEVTALSCSFIDSRNSKQDILIFGIRPSETHAVLQTLSSWKDSTPKALSSVTIHSPRFRTGKLSMHLAVPSLKQPPDVCTLQRQCPGCGRICSSAFCSTCGAKTNHIRSSFNGADSAMFTM
jgi:hypothetical protein